MNAKEVIQNILGAQVVMTGAYIVTQSGMIMIRKNRLYIYEYFCEEKMKYLNVIVLALEDEARPDYNSYSIDGFLYDVIDVLKDKNIIGIMADDLHEIGVKKDV
jgi:hypothetical protein